MLRDVAWCFVCCLLCVCVSRFYHVKSVCFVCVSLRGVVCGFLCVRCVCVRVSMYLCVLFVACCAMLYGLPLVFVVLCSCACLKMCRLCV